MTVPVPMAVTRTSARRFAPLDWLPMAIGPAVVLLFASSRTSRWELMWALAFAIFVGCKWLTWRRATTRPVAAWRHVAYLVAWPGLDADTFLTRRTIHTPSWFEWTIAGALFAVGIAIMLATPPLFGRTPAFVWAGGVGFILAVHFGAFHLLSCGWRSAGIDAPPLMRLPIAASSVADFWGTRWNTAFRDFTHVFVFRPAAQRFGPRAAVALAFLFSGIVHDLVITVPAGGAYGRPTAYFLIQAAGLFIERSAAGRRCGLGRSLRGWLFALAVVVGPVMLLFPPVFLTNVVAPFLAFVHSALFDAASDVSALLETLTLRDLIVAAGVGQLGVLVASALVPQQLEWQKTFQSLPRLHRQMYWIYGGYIVLSIVAFGVICLRHATELASGTGLARSVCGYIALFWGIRFALQAVLDVNEHLTTWWLRLGYRSLTLLFAAFTLIFTCAALHPA